MSCSTPASVPCTATVIVRTGFGLSMLFVGLTHYMTITDFVPMVSNGLGPLAVLGKAWAYVLPALLVGGGLLYALGMYLNAGTWLLGIGLTSIPAGLLLKPVVSGMPLGETMPPAVNALVWVIAFLLITRCCASCKVRS